MELLGNYNRGIRYLLCEIDLFSKYEWVFPMKDKTGINIVNAFQKIISKGRKPNKILVEQGGEFKNYLFKRFLKNTLKYKNEAKSAVAGTFSSAKILMHMTTISKNVYFKEVLDDIFKKYNNAVRRTIKMKPIDGTSDSYAEYNNDSNEKDPKFKFGDHVRIWEYKNILLIGQRKILFSLKLQIQLH